MTTTDWRGLCEELYRAFTAHARTDKQNDLLDRLQLALAQQEPEASQISDGYHTFAELYEHRYALCLALMRSMPQCWWFSQCHADGEPCFGGNDWFIVGADLPGLDDPSITYHLPMRLWNAAQATGARELPQGRPWDGHSANDVVDRLMCWTALAQPEPASQALADLVWPDPVWPDPTTITPCRMAINGRMYRLTPMDEPEPVGATPQCVADGCLDEAARQEPGSPMQQLLLEARWLLTRWRRPTPQPIPVSERLPEAGDCDAEGRCWLLTVEDGYSQWRLHSVEGNQPGGETMIWVPVDSFPGVMVDCFYATHWLPAHALPLPTTEPTP